MKLEKHSFVYGLMVLERWGNKLHSYKCFIIPCDQYDLLNTMKSSGNGHLKHKTESLAPGRGQSTWLFTPPQFCSWVWIENENRKLFILVKNMWEDIWGNVLAIAIFAIDLSVTDLLLLNIEENFGQDNQWLILWSGKQTLSFVPKRKEGKYLAQQGHLPSRMSIPCIWWVNCF